MTPSAFILHGSFALSILSFFTSWYYVCMMKIRTWRNCVPWLNITLLVYDECADFFLFFLSMQNKFDGPLARSLHVLSLSWHKSICWWKKNMSISTWKFRKIPIDCFLRFIIIIDNCLSILTISSFKHKKWAKHQKIKPFFGFSEYNNKLKLIHSTLQKRTAFHTTKLQNSLYGVLSRHAVLSNVHSNTK